MISAIIPFLFVALGGNNPAGYAIGALISLFILAYLIYSLIKPEKF
jgi:K+-transporting ATPase KdpF subunit